MHVAGWYKIQAMNINVKIEIPSDKDLVLTVCFIGAINAAVPKPEILDLL